MTAVLSDAGCVGRSTQPLAIRMRQPSRTLEIDWQDGDTTLLAHRQLRLGCRCAECVALRRRGEKLVAPVDIEVTDIAPYGSNTLHLTFSDGHCRGIFPFEYLRKLADR